MTDIEKEMHRRIAFNSDSIAAASACYEIHRREMIKELEEIMNCGLFFSRPLKVKMKLAAKIKEIKGE